MHYTIEEIAEYIMDAFMAGADGETVYLTSAAMGRRYVVGAPGGTILPAGTPGHLVCDAARDVAQYALNMGRDTVGLWIDADDGQIYIDPGDTFDNIEIALSVAASRGEIAIFDTVSQNEIRV